MKELIRLLHQHNYKCYIVGGAIRDKLLGKEPKDIDFAHTAPIEFLKERYPHFIDDASGEAHGIVRFIEEQNDAIPLVDFACLRKDDKCDGRHAQVIFTQAIEEDLARRDFTINAMAIEIGPNGDFSTIIDPFRGQDDIKNRKIRFVGNAADRIKEDYLRLLRGCRFVGLGNNWQLVNDEIYKEYAIQINTVSKERIRDELLKSLSYSNGSKSFRAMSSVGLLRFIFADLEQSKGCIQNQFHSEDVFNHLLHSLDATSMVGIQNPLLRLATLCHDIGKPATREVINNKVTFYKHDVIGSRIVYAWMKDLRFPYKDCEYVSKMVRHHQFRFSSKTTDKQLRCWLQAVGREGWEDLFKLRMCDRKGNFKKRGFPLITKEMKELSNRIIQMIESKIPLFKDDLAISGEDLIKLGLKPGPKFREIFSVLLGIVLTDPQRNNKDWLETYVKKVFVSKKEQKSNCSEDGAISE